MLIGILLNKNEDDLIELFMDHAAKFCDAIFALDDSDTDYAKKVITSCSKTKFFLHERDYSDVQRKEIITDGRRKVLLEEVKKKYGDKGWIVTLHTDEFWHHNPKAVAEEAEKAGHGVVLAQPMNFLLSAEDKGIYQNEGFELSHYFVCPVLENRIFKNKSGQAYNIMQKRNVLPSRIGSPSPLRPVFKHYLWRTPEQAMKKARERIATGWHGTEKKGGWQVKYFSQITDPNDAFIDDMRKIYKEDRSDSPRLKLNKFEGDFPEKYEKGLERFRL